MFECPNTAGPRRIHRDDNPPLVTNDASIRELWESRRDECRRSITPARTLTVPVSEGGCWSSLGHWSVCVGLTLAGCKCHPRDLESQNG